MANRFFLVLMAVVPSVAGQTQPASMPAVLRVLILSGKNNHDWRSTTPALRKLYEQSKRFTVDVTLDPSKCDTATFAKYDVIVSDWTNWPDLKTREWGDRFEKAFLDFVRGGKGFVVIHAASTPFATWPEFQELVGSWWDLGRTGHGAVHKFRVKIADPDHPITRGMKDFDTTDELWHRVGRRGKLNVLCTAYSDKAKGGSGQDEPVAHWRTFGKGRCFHMILGHDARAIGSAGFAALLLRGTEWAATGRVTIPAEPPADAAAAADPFAELAKYKAGASRLAATAVAEVVRQAIDDPAARAAVEDKLVTLLESEATPDAKAFACEQLSLIGSDRCVPAVAALLADEGQAYMARFALERIPGEAAGAALREALARAKGRVLVGVINSVARRRDAKAVAQMQKLLKAPDAQVAGAVLAALGQIGTPQAAKAISDHRNPGAPGPAGLEPQALLAVDQAYLSCGRQLLADGKAEDAAAMFAELYGPQGRQPGPIIRVAALGGLLAARPDGAQSLAAEALAGKDVQLVAVAADFAANSTGAEATRAYAAQLPKMSPAGQQMLLEALGRRGDAAALPAVLSAAQDKDAGVRVAALKALAGVGDSTAVPLLIRAATGSAGAERQAARASLLRLRAKDVDRGIVSAMQKAEAGVRVELIDILAGRKAVSAIDAVLLAAQDAQAPIRRAALEALAVLAAQKDLPELLKLLGKLPEEADREALERIVVPLCRQGTGAAGGAPGVPGLLAALKGAAGPAPRPKASLLRMLGRLGGADALAAVREAIKDSDEAVRDAAVRALVDWPDAAPADDLLAIAKEAGSLAYHVLAIRGYVRMVTTPGLHPRAKTTELLGLAVPVARRPEEKQMLQAAIEKAQWAFNFAVLGAATSPDDLESRRAGRAASGDQAAIDGNPATYWDKQDEGSPPRYAAAGGPDQKPYRLDVTFPRPVPLHALRIQGHAHHDHAPKDFDVLCDDKVVRQVRGAVYKSNFLVLELPGVKCGKLELRITGCYGRSPAIRELEAFDDGKIPPPPPQNIATIGKASSPTGLGADGGAGGPQAAIDANPDTYWDEVDNQKLYRLRVALRGPATVSAVRIVGYEHHSYSPKDFDVLCDDKVIRQVRDATYADNVLLVEIPPTRCEAVELRITGYYGNSPAIRELEILSPVDWPPK